VRRPATRGLRHRHDESSAPFGHNGKLLGDLAGDVPGQDEYVVGPGGQQLLRRADRHATAGQPPPGLACERSAVNRSSALSASLLQSRIGAFDGAPYPSTTRPSRRASSRYRRRAVRLRRARSSRPRSTSGLSRPAPRSAETTSPTEGSAATSPSGRAGDHAQAAAERLGRVHPQAERDRNGTPHAAKSPPDSTTSTRSAGGMMRAERAVCRAYSPSPRVRLPTNGLLQPHLRRGDRARCGSSAGGVRAGQPVALAPRRHPRAARAYRTRQGESWCGARTEPRSTSSSTCGRGPRRSRRGSRCGSTRSMSGPGNGSGSGPRLQPL